uniref:Uncharacterized protein n=1 Tax=Arundo donax TaxID=35708 RepID=A0A0A8Y3W9_ARUDO
MRAHRLGGVSPSC